MDGYRFPRFTVHHLDPAAQEFFPLSELRAPPMYDSTLYAPPPELGYHVLPPAFETPPQVPARLPPTSPTPTRAVLLSMVPPSASESTVRRELEIFGDVRAVQMERRREGVVAVHFYDVRDAQAALAAIQEQHMQQQLRLGLHYQAVANNYMAYPPPPPPTPPPMAPGLISGTVVWAQYINPPTVGIPDGNNQGTLVIFNLDQEIPSSHLKETFQIFGPVRELRGTPNKRNQKFVEFYDVRDAAKAISELNGREIAGKSMVIEFSRPGGQSRKFFKSPNFNGANSSKFTFDNSPPSGNSSFRRLPLPPQRKSFYHRSAAPWRGFPAKGNPCGSKSSSSGSSIADSFTKLNIIKANTYRKNATESEKSAAVSSSSRSGRNWKKPDTGGFKPWKRGGGGRHMRVDDPSFLINEDAIMESNRRDPRTTVMIKNIPNKYSQKLLLNMLDNHCIHCNEQMLNHGGGGEDQPLSSYDFVYLPIDFINKCNVGYGFVNMTSPEATLRLYKAFHHQNWEVFNSRKICEVTYARLQGIDALREHFKNSKFPGEAEEYMPVVFSPPRDGRLLTHPVPIIAAESEVEGMICAVNDDGGDGGGSGVWACEETDGDEWGTVE